MEKSGPDARVRLQQAAVELFQERGYDRTTAAEIAGRAGVTERTFFRHFPDKREVLFDGQAVLVEALATSIAGAPTELGPLDTLFRAFRSVTTLLEDNRSFSKPRQEVISATAGPPRTRAVEAGSVVRCAWLGLAGTRCFRATRRLGRSCRHGLLRPRYACVAGR